MIPASGTASEPAGNPFIYGKFPQVPMLFLPEPTGKILGTWQQCSGRKNFVQEDARFRHFPDTGNCRDLKRNCIDPVPRKLRYISYPDRENMDSHSSFADSHDLIVPLN